MSSDTSLSSLALGLVLSLSLGCSLMADVAADEHGQLAASAEETSPLASGDRAPNFVVRTVDNQPYTFNARQLERPTVLISFRGGWCPYCNLHLSELRNVVPALRDEGIDVLFLSGDAPDQLYSALKQETQEDIDGLVIDLRNNGGGSLQEANALTGLFIKAGPTVQIRSASGRVDLFNDEDGEVVEA